jgi:hypothetical protein
MGTEFISTCVKALSGIWLPEVEKTEDELAPAPKTWLDAEVDDPPSDDDTIPVDAAPLPDPVTNPELAELIPERMKRERRFSGSC